MTSYVFTVGAFLVSVSVPDPVAGSYLTLRCEWSPHRPPTLSHEQRRQFQRGMARATSILIAETTDAAADQRLFLDPDPCRTNH